MKPELKLRDQFESVLKNYTVSDEGLAILRTLQLVVMISPTSAGRNTMIAHMAEAGNYTPIVSDTTRPMRTKNGEVIETDGVQYFFRSEEDILHDLQKGLFIEAAIIHDQQVSGTSIRELSRAQAAGKIPILEVQQDGVHVIASEKPDAVFIFVLPPSFEEWMRRLKHRSDMTEHEVQNRLRSSMLEFDDALTQPYYKFVINDDIKTAVAQVRDIVEQGRYSDEQHQAGIALTKNLREQAEKQIR